MNDLTPAQLLAKHILLGADLRELWENFDTPNARVYLEELLEDHRKFLYEQLWRIHAWLLHLWQDQMVWWQKVGVYAVAMRQAFKDL